MNKKKQINEYDQTKEFLRRIRELNKSTKEQIKEQLSGNKSVLDDKEEIVKGVMKTHPTEPSGPIPNPPSENPIKLGDENSQESNWETPNNEKPDNETQALFDDKESDDKNKDFTIVNNVEVVINSTDNADLNLNDDEKAKISQLIDDFRSEVSEIAEFGKLSIYDDNAKLDGNLGEVNLGFTLSAGDDNGLFLSNASMVQINDSILEYIEKLKAFQLKFNDVLNEIISNRIQN